MSLQSARDQLINFLGHIKPNMRSFSDFCNHKSAICTALRRVFGFELGKDSIIMDWMKGWKIELPPQPRHDPDEDGWDVGLIVQYWSTQADNDELSTVELTYKCISLFAVSVYPRVSDLARLARCQTTILAEAMRYRYFGTKELRSVKVFTQQGGISRDQCTRVCPVLALKDYINRTSGQVY